MKSRLVKRKVVHQGRFLRFVELGTWEAVERTSPRPAVGIAALTEEGGMILVEQHRPPMGGSVIEVPAGLCGDLPGNSREPLVAAARRELMEETGYRARSLRHILTGPVSPGITDEQVALFVATGCRRAGEGGGDSTESIVVHVIPLQRVRAWLARRLKGGGIVDVKVHLALLILERVALLRHR